ncbi:hypothetical protein Tco_0330717, partial [Tanacetum coccineum]
LMFSDIMFTMMHTPDNMCKNNPSELTNPNHESKNIVLRKTIFEISKQAADVKAGFSKRLVLLQKDFERLEAHNISLELRLQNQSLTSGLSERFLKESSDVDNVNKDIDDIGQ